jgi:hypothetical protein
MEMPKSLLKLNRGEPQRHRDGNDACSSDDGDTVLQQPVCRDDGQPRLRQLAQLEQVPEGK